MQLALFIAKRIAFSTEKTFSRFIIRLSIAATTVSVAAMIITLAFVNGFQHTISEKVFSFWGHIRVQEYEQAKSIISEETPLYGNDSIVKIIKQNIAVLHVQSFATKSAVIEKNQEIEGVLFKGVDTNYNFQRLNNFLVSGKWPSLVDSLYSKQIAISASMANSLNIGVNDTINTYFIASTLEANTPKRKLVVSGIYNTGIEQYDKLFVLGDIRLLRRINNWENAEIGGYEVIVSDTKLIDTTNALLYHELPDAWVSKTIKDVFPNVFDWLNVQDVNKQVIFIVMAIVAVINLITCLLILVLERTKMVGLLKALGANGTTIQKIFLYYATYIASIGILLGCGIGLGICLLQQYTGFIQLDEAAYYVSKAPVYIIWWQVLLVCVATLLVSFLCLILPSMIVRKMQAVKAIAFR